MRVCVCVCTCVDAHTELFAKQNSLLFKRIETRVLYNTRACIILRRTMGISSS